MDHSQKAQNLFLEGYNCSQAVLCAFDDVFHNVLGAIIGVGIVILVDKISRAEEPE